MRKLDNDFKIVVTSTYMSEPMKDAFTFWQQKLGVNLNLTFTSLNSVFTELMDPSSEVRQNKYCNVIIVRFDDWRRNEDGFEEDSEEVAMMANRMKRNIDELVSNLSNVSQMDNGTYMVFVSPAIKGELAKESEELEKELLSKLQGLNNVYTFPSDEVEKYYDIDDYYDIYTDSVAHIPYKQNYFDVLATVICRKVMAFYGKPYKVVALDCDNTLWKGVLGEDGIANVKVDEGRQYLQRYLKSLKDKGMLLCLCSKNNEEEIVEAFDKIDGMVLSLNDMVAMKINWERKSENLRELASELNLGLDSFVFIDDNMAECMEVKMSAPQVLSLTLPSEDEEIKDFVRNIWALDIVSTTEADKDRTEKYKENAKRNEFAKGTTFEEFINGLELNVDIENVDAKDFDRAYQMMLRINQFNFTAHKYNNAEFAELVNGEDSIVIAVRAKDRFGDYGMIGLAIMKKEADKLAIANMLLSCRALGKGIEYQMMNYIGKLAASLGYDKVCINFEDTCRNQAASKFLRGFVGELKDSNVVDASLLANLNFKDYMNKETETTESDSVSESTDEYEDQVDYNDVLSEIAEEYNTAEKIHKAVVAVRVGNLGERAEYVAPSNEMEEKIVKIWEEILEVDHIGINDSLFSLGGESIKAIQILSRVREEFETDISLAVLFEGELTVARLAQATQDSILGSFDEDLLASELAEIENMSEEELEALLNGEI